MPDGEVSFSQRAAEEEGEAGYKSLPRFGLSGMSTEGGMYQGPIPECQSGSEGIFDAGDAGSVSDPRGQEEVWKEEMHCRTCLWRHEIQSEYERGSAERENKGQGRILDHVHCPQPEEDSELY